MTPTVSVLVTSYNRETYIAQSIESVLAQTFTDFELIVCDDASSDRSVEIASGYERCDSRVRVAVNARNLGDYGNRRQAASLATGRYLKYHDSDDVMYPHCLATMVGPLEIEPRAGFALSGSRSWPGGACPMLLTPALAYEREFLGGGLFHLGPAAALFRTGVFRDLGGFPEMGVASDYLFWVRACARVNVLLLPGDLFYYRIHAGQEASRNGADLQYARASAVAWRALNAPDCPLSGDACEQAKRNWLFTVARGAWRQARRGRFGAAAHIVRHADVSAVDWLRYLRPPHRHPSAGTPRETSSRCPS
jgi:glycosyltransferase involved in cell wall biosynthesis